jgi:RNA polymerase sigma factor (sigma-70 family)
MMPKTSCKKRRYELFSTFGPFQARTGTLDPETLLLHAADTSLIDETLRNLPGRFRELLVLREVEGLSYQELADVLGIPMGTVMSGLSRARQALRTALEVRLKQFDTSGRTASHVCESVMPLP